MNDSEATKNPEKPAWHVRIADVTAIMAVIAVIFTVAQRWAENQIRGEAFALVSAKVEKVDRLEWRLDGSEERLTQIQKQLNDQGQLLMEIRDSIMRAGFRFSPRELK